MAIQIKFGTDGWRAIIAKEYTTENVQRVAEATARWMKNKGMSTAVVGYDCRFAGKMFSEVTAASLAAHGIKCYVAPDFVSTPMVSLGVKKLHAGMGIVITASHNPPSYNGFKLKSSYGGPTVPTEIAEIEAGIRDETGKELHDMHTLQASGLIEYLDLEQMYFDHVQEHFDLDLIHKAGIKLAYDAMYGAGQRIVPRIFPNAVLLHCDYNPSFKGQAPEPIHRNLLEFSQLIKKRGDINFGLANDGDADRIGVYDENGDFVDSHRILLLLLYYLAKYKKMNGKVVVTFSVTEKMEKMARHFGFEYQVTPIGFKHIAEIMIHEPVIVAGEESGGLAVMGHIPERDGVWNGLILLEFMARTGKKLTALLEEVYEIVGRFDYDRDDLHIDESVKQAIIKRCKTNPYQAFGPYKVSRLETIDGFKFHFDDSQWVMIRPSGTEPVLRVYAQGKDMEEVRDILKHVHTTLKS